MKAKSPVSPKKVTQKTLSGRQTFSEIRNSIQQSLSKRPMTLYELATDTGVHKVTLSRHLSWLQSLGIVSSSTKSWNGKTMELWRLNR